MRADGAPSIAAARTERVALTAVDVDAVDVCTADADGLRAAAVLGGERVCAADRGRGRRAAEAIGADAPGSARTRDTTARAGRAVDSTVRAATSAASGNEREQDESAENDTHTSRVVGTGGEK